MTHQIATIARYTLLEALRTRLPHVLISIVAILGAASLFVGAIAITESTRMQIGTYAASMRLATVFVAAMYVLASVSREFNDKVLDVALALDLPRSHYILGKLSGFVLVAAGLALVAALPLAFLAAPQTVGAWALSLAFELCIVMALALFCGVTFRQPLAAASFIFAFYALARTLTAIRLMSAHPLTGTGSAAQQAAHWLAEGLALVMPGLDAWTATTWLTSHPPAWSAIAGLAAQSAVYVAFVIAAALFDFQRRSF